MSRQSLSRKTVERRQHNMMMIITNPIFVTNFFKNVCSFLQSDGEKSDQDLVVDDTNEVSFSLSQHDAFLRASFIPFF